MQCNNYKIFYTDLDDTLWLVNEFLKPTLRQCVVAGIEKGLRAEPEEAYEILMDIRKKKGSNYGKHFNLLCEHFNGVENRFIIDAMVSAYRKSKHSNMRPVMNVNSVFNFLIANNYQPAVVSNGLLEKQRDKLRDLNLLHYFEGTSISLNDGKIRVVDTFIYISNEKKQFEKPKPYMWLKVLEKITSFYDKEPLLQVHLGDRYYSDIFGGNSLGMITIKITQGSHKDETIEEIIESKFPKAGELARKLLKPDYEITDIREVPALIPIIESGYKKLKNYKDEQKQIAVEISKISKSLNR